MDLNTFVQNRVAKIQELYPNQLWRHVPSDQNPVDLVSRGVDPDKLLQQNMVRGKFKGNKVAGPLTTKEFEKAETFLVKKVQEQEFSSDINHLKTKPIVSTQIMGNLPKERLITDYPFNCSGVDFSGPFFIKNKGQAFIAALKRFMARRGKCAKLFSDNGKNFVGASNEIKKLLEIVRKPDEKLANYLAAEGIEWKFIPARSPNFGGLWEAAIKSYGDRFNSCQVIYSQFGLAIHQNDHQARRRFVEWAPNEIAVVPDFHKRILFSDEAHFWLNGYVNKQNWRIWSEANPQVYVETPLHPEKLTVWCALWAGGIIGPYFFKNDEGHNVTVNGDQYRAMITNFFIPELNNHDVQELWFQQDGATCHTARATIDLLKDTFGDRLISRFGPVNWPPRSCDLTPLDYFLWGYVKSLVYADKTQTLDHLEDNIRRVIADIRPQMLEKVIEN
ncbi:DUF4817 domain-containing protein [Trichonephila clavipes]|nr:DUF4817 domain-containing protein [Trichonephila clavipes]